MTGQEDTAEVDSNVAPSNDQLGKLDPIRKHCVESKAPFDIVFQIVYF